MIPGFSPLEVSLLKSSFSTKTDQELAELLERPVSEVVAAINQLTDGAAEARNEDAVKYQQEQEEKKRVIRNKPKSRALSLETISKRRKEEQKKAEKVNRMNQEERRRVENQRRLERGRYQTRQVDFSKMIAIKIDRKTHILVPQGSDIKKEKQKYHATQSLKNKGVSND